MTRQEAFIRWNTEIEDWLKYLKKREELIQIQEDGERQVGDLEKRVGRFRQYIICAQGYL